MKTRSSNQPLAVRLGLLSLLILGLAAGTLAVLAAGGLTIPLGRATGGGQIMTGGSYTVVGAAGQSDAGRLSGGGLRLNGGVIGEIVPQPQPPINKPRAYLPITWRVYPIADMHEAEPNDLFNQANPIPSLPVRVFGTHDGAAGGGDVFSLNLEAGREVEASLATTEVNGVQLLAYDASGVEITRAYAAPFELAFTTPYSGTYYVYVFSAPEANNNASYVLTIRAGSPLPGLQAAAAPAVDVERLNQPPQVEPIP